MSQLMPKRKRVSIFSDRTWGKIPGYGMQGKHRSVTVLNDAAYREVTSRSGDESPGIIN